MSESGRGARQQPDRPRACDPARSRADAREQPAPATAHAGHYARDVDPSGGGATVRTDQDALATVST